MKEASTKLDDEEYEAKIRRMGKKLRESPEWQGVRYILDAENNIPLQVMNQVLTEQARRKIN